MFSKDSYIEKYDAAAQQALGDERVLAAVQCGRASGMRTLLLSQVSGLGAILSMADQKKKAAGLPQLFFLAVTEDRLVVLKAKSSVSPKAGKELMSFPREAVTATSSPVALGTKIVLEAEDGTRIEAQGPGGELSDRVVRLLTPAGRAVAA